MKRCDAQQEHFGPLLGYCDHQMMKLMVRKLRGYDVSPMQCRTLTFLYEQQGDVTQKNLQEFLRVKPPTVNGIVERLEEKHLLTRSVSPGDGRCKLLHLTEEGRCFYQEFIAITEEVHRQAEQGFTKGRSEAAAEPLGAGGREFVPGNGGNTHMKKKKLMDYTAGYRALIVLGILCSAGEAVLELLLPQVMSDIVDIGIKNADRNYILMAGLKMVLMALVALALGVGAAVLASKAGMGFGANLRAAEYRQVQRFSFANIEHFSTASLITRLTNDVSSLQMTLMMGMRMLVRAPVMLVTALVMALIISTRLSQVFLVVIPLLVLGVVLVLRKVGPFFTSPAGGH